MNKEKQPKGFFYKTFSTITLVSLTLQIVTFSAFAYYILFPLGNRAAEDLSSLILSSAERWEQLESTQRAEFSQQVLDRYDLVLTQATDELPIVEGMVPPYVHWLSNSLSRHQNKPMVIKKTVDAQLERWFWFDIVIKNDTIRFGVPYSRIGASPSLALTTILFIALVTLPITAAIFTQRLAKPVRRLYKASRSIGRGNWPKPIKAEGPKELITLTQQFNKMSLQVQELLSNRTVLLAGIAHDLRTPLTQIHLALSMLPNDGGNKELMHSIQQDLDRINQLISEALNIATELNKESPDPSNPVTELEKLISNNKNRSLINITHQHSEHCQPVLYPMAFRRVLDNLITNAIRYSNQQAIDIVLSCDETKTSIQIKDQGPGIDKALRDKVFQPFYRLDATRNSATGGSGLGLAIVRQLTDLHHWKVELKNRKNGGLNAVFTVYH